MTKTLEQAWGPMCKRASSGLEIIDNYIIPREQTEDLVNALEDDDQSIELAGEIRQRLARSLQLTNQEEQALSRLQQTCANAKRWDAGLLRNNIFKAADLLGINLPSHNF